MESYIAVIFTSTLAIEHNEDYEIWSNRMAELVTEQPGFIDFVSARNPNTRIGITVAYFKDEESVTKWKSNLEHLEAQRLGRSSFYENYSIKVAKVYREYESGNLKLDS